MLVSYAGVSTPSEPTDSNSHLNSPALIDFGGGQGANIPHASHVFPTWYLILETAKVCTHNKKDGSSSSSHAKRMAQHYKMRPHFFHMYWGGNVGHASNCFRDACQGQVLGLFLHGVVYHKVHGRLGFLPCKSAPPSRCRFRVSCSVENYA